MKTFFNDSFINQVDFLSTHHYLVMDNFLSQELFETILTYTQQQRQQNLFKTAGIGALSNHEINKQIRNDKVYWLDKARDSILNPFFALMDDLVNFLNQHCFLSISDYEFHLTHYPKGSFYAKHLDQFKDRNNRLISVVTYLNANWSKNDGGELKLYLENDEKLIEPIAGRLVLMRSHLVPHEVLITHKDRLSLTGWLLRQPVGLGFLS